ncbi:hypothetical protein [Rhizobium grahamii]|uniref:Uncharacterized protein n=1 Tax=Rhizobium grahamii CCGE 502 TaxID=990285 RepID=S3HAW1_9HYPH|nr:hypothetical protein [Rhizobium grahamii]EPE95729.1 hypothetical protein RGCCGE502_22805 [Rhizobium grahamii CCGE 502]
MAVADDFSPLMLKRFLRLRVEKMARTAYPAFGTTGARAAKVELRKLSGLSREAFDLAYDGRLHDVEPRRRIWAALWVDPEAVGVTLTDEALS